MNITCDQFGTNQDKCSLHQSIRARRCFGVILGFLGTMHEIMLCCRRKRLIVEILIDRLIFMLAYRTKSVKEFISSRICSSLINRACRFVVSSGVQRLVLSPRCNIYRIYESSDVYNDERSSVVERFYVETCEYHVGELHFSSHQ